MLIKYAEYLDVLTRLSFRSIMKWFIKILIRVKSVKLDYLLGKWYRLREDPAVRFEVLKKYNKNLEELKDLELRL